MTNMPFCRYFDPTIQEQNLLTRSNLDAVISMSQKAVLESKLANWETMWPIRGNINWEYRLKEIS